MLQLNVLLLEVLPENGIADRVGKKQIHDKEWDLDSINYTQTILQ